MAPLVPLFVGAGAPLVPAPLVAPEAPELAGELAAEPEVLAPEAAGRSKPWMPPAVVPTGPGAAEADAFTPCSGRLGVGWPGSVVLAAMAAAATASQEPGPVAGALIEL